MNRRGYEMLHDGTPAVNVMAYHGEDAHAATRRAIVRAAAEVGRRMGDAQ